TNQNRILSQETVMDSSSWIGKCRGWIPGSSSLIAKPWQKWWRQLLNPARHGHASEQRQFRPRLELLEDRHLLSGFLVDNLNNAGAGSLRAAILAANANPGFDTIQF